MTEFKPTETSSTLLASGKSSRLREMRNKNLNLSAPAITNDQKPALANLKDQIQPELLLAQQLIDQQLAEILAGLPAGKQRSLFKIRYGIDLDTLKQQPIHRIIQLLKIKHPQLLSPRGAMKNILELTYNGQHAL